MSRVPTITLWSGKDFVIVEPGGSADRIWRSRGYTDKQPEKQVEEEIPVKEETPTTLFPAKKRGRPKKVKDIGKTNYKETQKTS